jgi:hypothetical protein
MTKILYSPGFGAGWSTWADNEEDQRAALTDPELIETIRGYGNGSPEFKEALANFAKRYPDMYLGGARDLAVYDVGDRPFRVNEYDGNESIEFATEDSFLDPKDLVN